MSSLLAVKKIAKTEIKRAFRDKVALFFVFVFPLIFLVIFGGLFGKQNNVSFEVVTVNESTSEQARMLVQSFDAENSPIKQKKNITTLSEGKELLSRSEVDAIFYIPSDFGKTTNANSQPSGMLTVLYNQQSEQSAQALQSILSNYLNVLNVKTIGTNPTPFQTQLETVSDKSLSRFDYTFAGLLGFSILGLGIFGPTQVFPQLKKQGVLRRYHTTTLKVWQYFTANVISQAAIGILSVSLLFICSVFFFNLSMRGDYVSLAALTVIGVAVLFGVGLAVGGWAKNENQAAPLANLISFPMMFLSGTFFPRYAMPEWLKSVSDYLPLTPVIDGFRMIVAEGKTLFDLGPQLLILGVWGVVIYIIAFRVFRWE